MLYPKVIIIFIVGRCDFQSAGTKFHIDIFILDNTGTSLSTRGMITLLPLKFYKSFHLQDLRKQQYHQVWFRAGWWR